MTVDNFIKDSEVFDKMVKRSLKKNYVINHSDKMSWSKSITAMKDLCKYCLKYCPLFSSTTIMFEMWFKGGRVDVCLLGHSNFGRSRNMVLLELKQWSDPFISLPDDSPDSVSPNILTKYKDGESPIRKIPSYQISNYKWNAILSEINDCGVNITGVAYCFNCEEGSNTDKILHNKRFEGYLKDCQLYIKNGQNGKTELAKRIKKLCWDGNGFEIYKEIHDGDYQ